MMDRIWNTRFSVLVAFLVIAAGACGSVRGPYVWSQDVALPADPGGYLMQVGDLLSVQVWDNEKLSARGRVRSDGKFSIPLLGDMDVSGRTPEEFARETERRFAADSLIVRPRVTVLVEESAPLTVSVLGKVGRAGTVALSNGAGVAEALAGAGGLTEFAHKDRIFVLRRNPTPTRVRFTFASLTDLASNAVQFRLRAGDVVVVE